MLIYKKENIDSFRSVKAPENFSATMGDLHGEIDLQWEPGLGAKYYILQICNISKISRWKEIDIIFKSSCTVSNLKSGHKYRFRIASGNSNGQSEWSNEIEKISA